VRNISAFILVLVLTLGSKGFAGNVVVTPTTTLATESNNNTSAPNSISGSTNGIAVSGNISKVPFRNAMYPGATTKVFTTLLGWFGETGHISVASHSPPPSAVGPQIDHIHSSDLAGPLPA
jgi:hypothetical protein